MEEIVKQYLECISRSRKAQRLLMEIEVEHIERVRKALNDTADLNR